MFLESIQVAAWSPITELCEIPSCKKQHIGATAEGLAVGSKHQFQN